MESKIEIVKKEEFKTSSWSGGTTTQLLIYPKEAQYDERNFKWRISSAKVEAEESTFTHLPGISRIIMVIDGKLFLEHEGKEKISLEPFQQDSFMGDITTKSFGKCTDFNLMMKKGHTGKLEALVLDPKSQIKITNEDSKVYSTTDVFYAVNGDIEVKFKNKQFEIQQGDLFYIEMSKDKEEFYILNKEDKEINIIKAVIDDRYAITEKEEEEILNKYFKEGIDGPLSTFPVKEKRKLVVLKNIIKRFEYGKIYNEKEVNNILKNVYSDYVMIRRCLIDYGFMDRKNDGSEYWVE